MNLFAEQTKILPTSTVSDNCPHSDYDILKSQLKTLTQEKQTIQAQQDTTLKKINVNTALSDEMKAHPYIRYALANAIIQYRTQHGNFSSIDDLKKIMLVTDDMYKKVEPYVTVGE